MNEKEWLVVMIEDFISDTKDFIGNTDESKLIPIMESIIESLKHYINMIKKIETDVWIDENHNDKITIDRKDFEDELKEILYYDLITRRAFTGLLQWFDEYKNEKIKRENLKVKYEYKVLDIDEYITDDVLEKKLNSISDEDWRLKEVMNLPSEMKPYNRQLIFERKRLIH